MVTVGIPSLLTSPSIIPLLSESLLTATPASNKSESPSLSESISWKSSILSLSLFGINNRVVPFPLFSSIGLFAVSGATSTTSANPSLSVSVVLSTIPLLSVSTPPASSISKIPSLSVSRSSESMIPSPSVSLLRLPLFSTTSGIPSLSSSISKSSTMPSPSESIATPVPNTVSLVSVASGIPSLSVSVTSSIIPSPFISTATGIVVLFGSNISGILFSSASGRDVPSTKLSSTSAIPSLFSSNPPTSSTSFSPSLSESRSL